MRISAIVQQDDAPWGISRLSLGTTSLAGQNLDPLSLTFPYFSDDSAGAGTDVYVLDTGILETHDEFEGRATFLATFGPGVEGQDVNGRKWESPFESFVSVIRYTVRIFAWLCCFLPCGEDGFAGPNNIRVYSAQNLIISSINLFFVYLC
jgi:hypothetical protein